MKKLAIIKIIWTLIITVSLAFTASAASLKFKNQYGTTSFEDLDPLVDVTVTVEIQQI